MGLSYCRSVVKGGKMILIVKHQRKEESTWEADATIYVAHRVSLHTPNVGCPLLELVVQEFQNVYTVRVYWKGKQLLFASDRYYPVIGWLGRKWHQRQEESHAYDH